MCLFSHTVVVSSLVDLPCFMHNIAMYFMYVIHTCANVNSCRFYSSGGA